MQQRNYKDFIEEYLKFTENFEATTRCHLWSIISVLAATMERRIWMDRGYILYPNLYVFIIGKSGLVKKSTTTGIAVSFFRELKNARMMSERLTAASLISQLSESGKPFTLNGKSIKQSPLFAYASELSVFMEEVFGPITPLLTTFYDCEPQNSEHPWTHKTRKDGAINIYGPCLNFLGASTKTWLRNCIPRNQMEGGFTSRVVFVVENSTPNPIAWPTISVENQGRRIKLIDDLKHIYQLKGEMRYTPEVYQLFDEWYTHHVRKVIPKNVDPAMSGYLARKGDLILKIAMVRSVSLRDDLIIEAGDFIWALEEIDKIEPNWRLAFDGLNLGPSLGFRIRDYIYKRGAVPKKFIFEIFGAESPVDLVDEEITLLLEQNIILEAGDCFTFPGAKPV